MTLSLDTVRAVTEGAERVEYENCAFHFYRFTETEMATNSNPNRAYAAGVSLCFRTDAEALSLSVFTESLTGVRSYFALEVFVNDSRIGVIKNFEDARMTGNYADVSYPLGEFFGEFSLGSGEKTVKIILPHSVKTLLREISLDGESFVTALPKKPFLIAYGDSITQGYDALYPSETYASRLADMLDLTLINKGLGGATFSPALARADNGRQDGCILVAYGTNDWRHLSKDSFRKNAAAFLDAITAHYSASDIFVLSPIWRGDSDCVTTFGSFESVADLLRELCKGREKVHFVFGENLVPHEEIYFGDIRLHPTGAGFAHYAAHLYEVMTKKRL